MFAKKVFSLVLLFGLVVQPIAPSFFMSGFFISKAQAADESTAAASVDEEDVVDEAEEVEAESVEEVAPIEEGVTTPEAVTEEEVALESEASEVATTEDTEEEKTEEVTTPEVAPIVTKEVATWQKEGDKAVTTGPVELGVKYEAPQNKEVTVTFTKLPETPGTLTIEEITLTKEQIAQTGSLSDKAYDITSSMENGSFEYELTLPIPEGKENVQVLYADKVEELNEAQVVKAEDVKTEGDSVKAELDHFTVFVASYSSVALNVLKANYFPGETVYAKATISGADWLFWHRLDVVEPNGTKHKIAGCSIYTSSLSGQYVLPGNTEISSDWKVMASRGYLSEAACNADFLPIDPLAKIQNFSVDTRVLTLDATDVTPTNAILNGKNGNSVVTNHSFWVSTSPFTTTSPTIPSGVHSTQVLGPLPAGQNFSVPLSLLVTSAHNGDNIPAITPNTIYYFVAWVEVGGIWYPGEIKSFITGSIPACNSSSFDSFSIGSVNSQGGWSATGSYDQAIVDNIYGFSSFGCKSLRVSNAVTSGSFGDWIFSNSISNEAGETTAVNSGLSGGIRQDHFEAEFAIASTTQAEQPGLQVTFSPDRGDGARMSYLRFQDSTGGIDVYFYDYDSVNGFIETKVADDLSFTEVHTAKFAMDFVDGPGNDVVKIYIDGILVHTGTSWEDYFRDAQPSIAPPTVDSLLIRQGGSAILAHDGNGYLFDNFDLSSSTNVIPDTIPPVVPSMTYYENTAGDVIPSGSYTDAQQFTFNLSSDEDTTRYQLKYWNDIVGSPYKIGSPWNPDNLSGYSSSLGVYHDQFTQGEGKHYFAFSACDAAGNCSAYSAPFEVTYDITAPGLPVHESPADNSSINYNTFTFQWTDVVDAVEYEFQSSQNPAQSGGVLTTGVWNNKLHGAPDRNNLTTSEIPSYGANGTWYWQVRAKDAAGNWSAWTAPWKLTIDMVAPVAPTNLTVNEAGGDSVTNGGFTNSYGIVVNWGTVADAVNYEYRYWNSIPGDAYNAPNYYVVPQGGTSRAGDFTQGEGLHHIQVRAQDAAGNWSAWSSPFDVTYDKTNPSSIITTFGVTNGGTVETPTWDGLIEGTAADTLSGVHHVNLVIKRNLFSTPGVDEYWNGTDWQATEVEVTATGTDSWTYALPAPVDGTYTVVSHAVDNAGNKESTYTITIILDKTIPEVSLAIDPSNPNGDSNWYVTEPVITLTANDNYNVDYIEYQLNGTGGAWTTYTGPVTIADGTWQFYYRSVDTVGNVSGIGVKNVKVDTQDPDEVNGLDAEYREQQDDIKLDWNVDDNDIDKVYIYRGGSRNFNINSGNKVAENDANDETYSDNNPDFGETYYYKLVSIDEAGNRSGARVIKVEMPENEGGTATVTDEGTDAATEGEVLGVETTDNAEGTSDQGGTVTEDGSVLGATDENGDTNGIMDFIKKYSWWWLIILLIIGYTSYRYYVAKKENQNPLV